MDAILKLEHIQKYYGNKDILTISENIALALAINQAPASEVEPRIMKMAENLNITTLAGNDFARKIKTNTDSLYVVNLWLPVKPFEDGTVPAFRDAFPRVKRIPWLRVKTSRIRYSNGENRISLPEKVAFT